MGDVTIMGIPSVTCVKSGFPYPYGKLTDKARLAISLSKYTFSTDRQIARILGLEFEQLAEFLIQIARSQEGAAVMSMGMPATYGEPLPDGEVAICSKCKRKITWVPCVTCCGSKFEYRDRLDMSADSKPKPQAIFSTDANPGTDAKIEVLRQRVADGFDLWHPKDAKIPD